MSKKVKILILCSLLLNVLLFAVIVGHVSYRLSGRGIMRHHAMEFVKKLPAEKKTVFLERIERVHRENRGVHKQIREAREKAIAILTAPEFDGTAYQVQVEKLHNLRGRMRLRLADAIREMAGQLSQEERKALAKHLRRPPRPPRDIRYPHPGGPPAHRMP